MRASTVSEKLVRVLLNFSSCYTHGTVLLRKVIQSTCFSWTLQKLSTGFLIITCCISYSVMASKVSCFSWFHDYLSDRTERVITGGHSSEWMEVTSGVPQGSILGPLLFLLYINDFPLSVSCNTELFPDDSVLYRKITTEDDCV